MDGAPPVDGTPPPACSLLAPLLEDAEVVQVEVWEFSREWSEFDVGSDSSGPALLGPRADRYRPPMGAGAATAAERAAEAPKELGPPLFFGRSSRGCCICLFYFLQQNVYTLSVVLIFCFHRGFTGLCLAPPWVGLVCFETWLAFNDRLITGAIRRLRRKAAYCSMVCFVAFVGAVLGCLFGYLLLRAGRHWQQKGQRTFMAELATFGKSESNCIDATRLDTLVRVLTSVPVVACLPWILAIRCKVFTSLELFVYAFLVTLCLVDLVVSISDFDYSVSRHIRKRYGMKFENQEWFQSTDPAEKRFQRMHVCFRLAEIIGRVLVLVAAALASVAFPWWAAACVAMDFLLGVVALQWVSGYSSKAALLCIPFFLVDLACYIDESGMGASAQTLSKYSSRLHATEMAIAAAVYACSASGALDVAKPPLGGAPMATFLGCVMVASHAAKCVLRPTIARPSQAGDLFCSPPGDLLDASSASSLKDLFGKQLGVNYRPSKRLNIASFMFSNGVGEQLDQLRESLHQNAKAEIRLRNLKTVSILGAGGFGKVVKVQDASTGDFYALKLQQKAKGSKCAIREAQALSWSEHPFTVRLVQVFQTAELFGILMEYCEYDMNQCILREVSILGRVEGLPEPRAARYSVCMMLALEHLHGKRIVFRDLKPENVLITSEEKGDHAKLTDFGLARPLDRLPGHIGDASPMFMSPGAGTPAFMAQEAFAHAEPIDFHRSTTEDRFRLCAGRDWYSLGCCILLLLLGEDGGRRITGTDRDVLLPPPGGNIMQVLRQAARQRRIAEDAFHLISVLTAADVAERAGSAEMRSCPWLSGAMGALEAEMQVMLQRGRDSTARIAADSTNRSSQPD